MASVHWFRHGLRLHDNPALLAALRDAEELYPIFILDGEVAGTKLGAFPRMRFLHQSLQDLDQSLRSHGNRLFVFRGQPREVFDKVFDDWNVKRLTFEQDPEPVWLDRDNAVKRLCKERGVQVIEIVSHTLWDPAKVLNANGGMPPHTYRLFTQVVDLIGPPPRPVGQPDFTHLQKVGVNLRDKYLLPTYEEFGPLPESPEQEQPHNRWLGGETEALSLFKSRMEVEERAFREGDILPNQLKVNLVSRPLSLSPYLRFGCLSIRHFYWVLRDKYEEITDLEAPVTVMAQLIWREFFYCMAYNNPNFDRVQDNPICLEMPWHSDQEKLDKWTNGQTGFPWIDACMNQLRHEGWMHHVCRHAAACFLTRGDLWLSWEDGVKVFSKYLLDGDWSLCAGNWMWASSSAFEDCLSCPQCFSPIILGHRMDPTGQYTRRYVPAVAKLPLRYLFSPWTAPLEVQRKAGCIVGQDYPEPMVDHLLAWRQCKARMEEVKAAFKDPGEMTYRYMQTERARS